MDWDNPLVVKDVNNVRENACRPNQIVFIGDTNTHYDIDLPGYGNSTTDPLRFEPKTSTHVKDEEINVSTLADTILNLEGIDESRLNKGDGSSDVGAWSGNSRFGMPALAYWGHINDIQKGLAGKQNINTFMIDVVENGDYKANYQGMKIPIIWLRNMVALLMIRIAQLYHYRLNVLVGQMTRKEKLLFLHSVKVCHALMRSQTHLKIW